MALTDARLRATVGRRAFLSAALGAGGVALAACGNSGGRATTEGQPTAGLSAKGSGTGPGPIMTLTPSGLTSSISGTPAGGPAAPPVSVPHAGVKADLPPAAGGVPATFFHYPAEPPTISDGPIGSGGTVSMMAGSGVGIAEGKNRWWQALNESAGVEFKFNNVEDSNYTNKFQTTVAGGDLPDMLMVSPVPDMVQVLDSRFADLTDYLSGDAEVYHAGFTAGPAKSP